MTNVRQESKAYGVQYYEPSPSIVDYLQTELQNLEKTDPATIAGKRREYRRKKQAQNRIAKDKKDTFHKVFQCFVDLVYFLEFIEIHPELHELYEESLKDLFGISGQLDKEDKKIQKAWHRSLFIRFLSASLFYRYKGAKKFDFRISLAQAMFNISIDEMQTRLEKNNYQSELKLFLSNNDNTKTWVRLIADRYNYNFKPSHSRHKIVF